MESATDYLADHPVTGLLIARSDSILYEHYPCTNPCTWVRLDA
jgi:hypothetical protein